MNIVRQYLKESWIIAIGYMIILEAAMVAAILYWPKFSGNIPSIAKLVPFASLSRLVENISIGGYWPYFTIQHFFKGGAMFGMAASALFSSILIARELARMNLTLNTYTQWYWKIDLNNLLHFLALRADGHAQYEIRVYADAMLDIVRKWVPLTYAAFEDYRVGGTEVSAKEINLIKKLIKGEKVSFEEEGLSKREWAELQRKFDIK